MFKAIEETYAAVAAETRAADAALDAWVKPSPVPGRSAAPYCKGCGGLSWSAPNQYRGHHHLEGCRLAEWNALKRAAYVARKADQEALTTAYDAVDALIATSPIGLEAATRGQAIKVERRSVFQTHYWEVRSGGFIQVTGTLALIEAWWEGSAEPLHLYGF